MKKIRLKFCFLAAILLMFTFIGCEKENFEDVQHNNSAVEGSRLKSYQSGTNNGYFWSLWTDDASGWVNYSNGSGGNYSVSWDYSGNFTCGKGWSSGSRTRIIGYNCGAYTCNGGGVFGYYGWTRNPLIEYYVNEKWGSGRPTGERKGSLNSDGGTYDIYTAMRYNAPSIEGTQTFRQIFSTRTSQVPTGENRTITFANHANAWANVGLNPGSDFSPSAILLTEAYGGSNGYVNATVWEAGSSSGGGSSTPTGTKRFRNRGTGLYLDGMGRTTNGADVGQWANTTHNNAYWTITSAGSGYYYLVNKATNMKLDGYGRTNNGDPCAQYSNVTTHVNAQWQIVD